MFSGGNSISGRSVHLTFDDGFESNHRIGIQVLPQMGIRATYFVIPGFVESSVQGKSQKFISERLFPGELVSGDVVNNLSMSWNQIRELSSFGHEIGSHTMTHPRLNELSDSEIRREFVDSRTKIADETGKAPRQLAITFGDIRSISRRVLVLAYEHYEVVHTSIRGSNRDRGPLRTVCRETVHPWDTKQFVLATLKGTLDIQYRKSRLIMDSWTEKN
jgi:peptidoglycan/xylan/chitin deacetylase (PgdA/CDA1 family)